MGRSGSMWLLLLVVFAVLHLSTCSPRPDDHEGPRRSKTNRRVPIKRTKPKLLYIMLDGFRWDYVDMQTRNVLRGFDKFLSGGVRANWTDPLFPSLSYPTWTTLVTGQYAETHGIVGNYFYDPVAKDVFSLFDPASTGKQKWWKSEPIWTTAEKAGLKTAQYLWARCDVPINGITTHYCQRFEKIPGKDIFQTNIMNALEKLDREGYDFVQVYTEHTDDAGHNYGPDSVQVSQAVRDLDDVINTLLEELEDRELTDHVNIVIVSDHGMAYTAPGAIMRHEIDNYLDTSLVENIADKGALMNIKVSEENLDRVERQLNVLQGVDVYRKQQIPDEFHYKNGKYVHEIVLVADQDHFIMASNSTKQLPRRSSFVYHGAHGYNPEYKNMKGIFFAKGPAFKEGVMIEPIHVVDVYQVLTTVLNLNANPHNGTWSAVEMAFKPEALISSTPQTLASATAILIMAALARLV